MASSFLAKGYPALLQWLRKYMLKNKTFLFELVKLKLCGNITSFSHCCNFVYPPQDANIDMYFFETSIQMYPMQIDLKVFTLKQDLNSTGASQDISVTNV